MGGLGRAQSSRAMRLACVLAALLSPALAAAELSFTDITATAGVAGPSGDDAGGHGAMWADVTGDGRPDLYMPFNWKTVEYPDYFYRNTGGNAFAEEAQARGIDDRDGGSHGACWADLDNDGDYDLVNATTLSYGANSNANDVYRNDGTGYFADVTPNSIRSREEVTRGVIAFDMDADGDLDLFCVTNYQGSSDPASERNEVYRNDGGDFSFTAIAAGALYECPAGQGATDTDYDGDGDVDVFAANRGGDVNILANDGAGAFTRVAPSSIGITDRANDGITTADIDNDGDLDLLLAGDGYGKLYLNDGDGTFSFKEGFSGTGGYMGGFADLDNDGDLDLIFAGGGNAHLNDGTGNFTQGPAVPNAASHPDARGIAFADTDGDGDLDFVVAGKRAPNLLIRNDYNGSNNWLEVKLISPQGQAGAFGAKTRVYPAGGAGGTLLGMRESKSNYGYLGQDDPVLHFGLGSRDSVDVVVTFLGGAAVTRAMVAANQTITIDGAAAGNVAPVAQDQELVTTEGAPATMTLSYDDPDNGPGPDDVTIVTDPLHGTLTGVGTDRTYTPEGGYTGTDSFTWKVHDGEDESNTATVRITVYKDTDGDGLPDWWEQENGLDPNQQDSDGDGTLDADEDTDGDGANNLEAFHAQMHPRAENGSGGGGAFSCHPRGLRRAQSSREGKACGLLALFAIFLLLSRAAYRGDPHLPVIDISVQWSEVA